MERIGFFGGCFNPPTNMHINIANNLVFVNNYVLNIIYKNG